ncbi:MAG: pyridoxal phosphate-dependent aminotransferase [Planctomycetes bacterium]|nr:pyridoxal phosphate-dependent aminotransferase [Planctomycetota bacterium]MCB9868952.1 pyridoxal phosphate-dependent aminotransferase [Planctomycetota bacterium]
MSQLLHRFARRRDHLEAGNLLRSLTETINRVPGGINLGQGVCDLDSPAPLRAGAIECIEGRADRQTYTFYSGIPELREAIARKLREFNGLDCTAANVGVTAGSSGAFFATGMTLLDPGDEVILFEPFYSYHFTVLKLMGAVPVCVPLSAADLAFDPDRLRAALTPRTRALVLNTPGNPSGKVFSVAELTALAEVLAGTSVVVLTDEVYEYMCYDDHAHVSPATVPGLADRTVTISSFSKTFSITGWRIGYLAGPTDLVDRVGRVFDQVDVCAARPMQRGVQRALEQLPASFYSDLRSDYQRRRDRFCAALSRGGFGVQVPQGAYYVLADYREVFGDVDPESAVRRMIDERRVNGVPGHLFFARPDGVRSIRFHFAVADAVLDEACARLGG